MHPGSRETPDSLFPLCWLMRRIVLWLSVTGLLIGLAGGSPTGWVTAQGTGIVPSSGGTAKAAKVDLNRAGREEIVRLPGMTPEVAARIIQKRPYRKLDDLISRKVVGKKQFAEIREYIVIGAGGM
jgi:DNA uptake protein ComE-like DNA-binding protein